MFLQHTLLHKLTVTNVAVNRRLCMGMSVSSEASLGEEFLVTCRTSEGIVVMSSPDVVR